MASGSLALFCCGIALSGAAIATEEEVPDLEFLEYLGMWEETDEEWQVLEEKAVAGNEERSDLVSEDEESMEKKDET